jgi:hypothetical protein
VKEVLNSRTKIPAHNRPSLLEEGGVAIRVWGLLILNAKNYLMNILMRDRGEEKAMRARWKTRATLNNCTVKGNNGLGSA